MKQIFTAFFCLLTFITCFGQQNYYWSGKKKHYLSVDSTNILLQLKETPDKESFSKATAKLSAVNTSQRLRDSNLLLLSLNKSSKKRILEQFKKDSAHIELLAYSFRFESTLLTPTGTILLKPKEGVSIGSILSLAGKNVRVVNQNKYQTFTLKVKDIIHLLSVANRIYESGLVEWCHPDFIAEIVKHQTDPLYPDQYYLNNTGQLGGTANIDINAPEAWNISRGVNNVRVAVIDDGVENHEDFNGRVLPGFTPRNPNGFGAPENYPGHGHGQACAGIIAATHNTLGIAGVAPCTQIVPVNIFSDWFIGNNGNVQFRETAENLAAAINWAWNEGQADVLSNSWSYGTTNGNDIPNFDAIVQAINNARTQGRGGRGSLVVFASGNAAQQFQGVTFPANVDGVITVGAINNQGNLWNYSSRGAQMDLVAPSGDVNLNGNVRTTDRMNANGYEAGNYTPRFGGTSAACPQVAGVAALMLSVNPNLTEVNVVTLLRTSAIDMGATGFDNGFGFGRLNAWGAVRSAMSVSGPAVVCTAAMYTVPVQPVGTTVIWSSNTTSVSINANGVATRLNNYDGSATITATINGGCGNAQVTKNVWVGNVGGTGGITVTGNARPAVGGIYGYSLSSVPQGKGTITYRWRIPAGNGWAFLYPNTDSHAVYVVVGSTVGSVEAYWANECGVETGTYIRLVPGNGGPGPQPLSVYPNPSNDYLNITVESANPEEMELVTQAAAPSSDEYQIKLYDAYSQVRRSAITQDGALQLDTRQLPNGIYYLHATQGREVIRQRVIIQH